MALGRRYLKPGWHRKSQFYAAVLIISAVDIGSEFASRNAVEPQQVPRLERQPLMRVPINQSFEAAIDVGVGSHRDRYRCKALERRSLWLCRNKREVVASADAN